MRLYAAKNVTIHNVCAGVYLRMALDEAITSAKASIRNNPDDSDDEKDTVEVWEQLLEELNRSQK